MVRIAIIADTHLKSAIYQSKIISNLKRVLDGFDFIFHAGDIVTKEIFEEISDVAPITAVKGNCDEISLDFLPRTIIKEVEGKKIVMAHRIEDLENDYNKDSADVVISGHLHYPIVKEIKNKEGNPQLIINPGSLIEPRVPSLQKYCFDAPVALPSMAILEISEGVVSAMIKRFGSKKE